MVPCSMRSLAAMAYGLGDNLLVRAADVVLKEKRRLVIAPREAPLHEGHLEAMLRLARMGAVVALRVPPFYAVPIHGRHHARDRGTARQLGGLRSRRANNA